MIFLGVIKSFAKLFSFKGALLASNSTDKAAKLRGKFYQLSKIAEDKEESSLQIFSPRPLTKITFFCACFPGNDKA